jgi:hypothetical protein
MKVKVGLSKNYKDDIRSVGGIEHTHKVKTHEVKPHILKMLKAAEKEGILTIKTPKEKDDGRLHKRKRSDTV